jgi:probable O-glycosylation ligase (exosortase A-associated)
MRDIVAVLIIPILVYYSLKRPFIALGLWLWSASFHIGMMVYGFALIIPFNKIFAITTIISFINYKHKPGIKINLITILIILFYIVATISNQFPLNNADISTEGWLDYTKIVVFYLFAVAILEKKIHYDFMIWLLVAAIGGLASAEGVKLLLTGGSYRTGIVPGVIGDNNFFGVMAGTVLPFTNYLRTQTNVKHIQTALIASMVLISLGIFATYSRGALLGIFIFVFFFIQKSKNKVGWTIVVIILTILIMGLLPDAWFDRMNTMKSSEEDNSFMGRVVAWKISALVAMHNPFGGGFRAIEHSLTWFTYAPGLYNLDFIISTNNNIPPGYMLASHSVYFQILGNQGFIGLFLFLLIIFVSFIKIGQVHRIAKATNQQWAVDLSKMIQISLLIYCVTGGLVAMAYFDFIYAVFAIITTLEATIKPKS